MSSFIVIFSSCASSSFSFPFLFNSSWNSIFRSFLFLRLLNPFLCSLYIYTYISYFYFLYILIQISYFSIFKFFLPCLYFIFIVNFLLSSSDLFYFSSFLGIFPSASFCVFISHICSNLFPLFNSFNTYYVISNIFFGSSSFRYYYFRCLFYSFFYSVQFFISYFLIILVLLIGFSQIPDFILIYFSFYCILPL